MANDTRARKLADRIKVVVAETLDKRVKDPRLGFVTITDARITGDLREATVFYTVLGDESERAESAAALESVRGLLRSEVGRRTGVKHTPSLAFVADAIPEAARHLEDLLRVVRQSDAELEAMASGAAYAGDAEPYRSSDADADPDTDSDGETPPGGAVVGRDASEDSLGPRPA